MFGKCNKQKVNEHKNTERHTDGRTQAATKRQTHTHTHTHQRSAHTFGNLVSLGTGEMLSNERDSHLGEPTIYLPSSVWKTKITVHPKCHIIFTNSHIHSDDVGCLTTFLLHIKLLFNKPMEMQFKIVFSHLPRSRFSVFFLFFFLFFFFWLLFLISSSLNLNRTLDHFTRISLGSFLFCLELKVAFIVISR